MRPIPFRICLALSVASSPSLTSAHLLLLLSCRYPCPSTSICLLLTLRKKKYTLVLFKEFMALGHLGELGFSVLCPLLSVVSHQV